MASQVYLLRHGQTEWSLSGRHTGVTDVPLTARGESEARALARRLSSVPFSLVLTSPRVRARRTCALADLGVAAQVADDLREWDYGDFEGLLSDEIRARRPGWNIFDDGCPGGESPSEVGARADRILERLAAVPGTVAVFSHGHFTRVLAARWLRRPVADATLLASSTGSVNILGTSPNGPRPVLMLWNEVPPLSPDVLAP